MMRPAGCASISTSKYTLARAFTHVAHEEYEHRRHCLTIGAIAASHKPLESEKHNNDVYSKAASQSSASCPPIHPSLQPQAADQNWSCCSMNDCAVTATLLLGNGSSVRRHCAGLDHDLVQVREGSF
jgi:hypothetical protein